MTSHGNLSQRILLHSGNIRKLVLGGADSRRRVLRRYAFDASGLVSSAVVSGVGPHRYLVSTADKSIGRTTFATGAYDAETLGEVQRIMVHAFGKNPVTGKVFVDVGANIGTSTIPALKEWGASGAVCIEPEPENFRLLQCNLILNDVADAAHCRRAAVSREPGSLELQLSKSNSGDNRVKTQESAATAGFTRSVTVQAERLDVILEDSEIAPHDVGLVWVDTQGHEGHVLASAPSVLSAGVPFLVEYWPSGLSASGGLSLFEELVRQNFSRLFDVRTGIEYAAQEVSKLRAVYNGASAYSDLLLVP
jgi:FkbM family methyltransferase